MKRYRTGQDTVLYFFMEKKQGSICRRVKEAIRMKADSMAKRRNRIRGGALLLITAGVLAACGKELPKETNEGRIVKRENIEDG